MKRSEQEDEEMVFIGTKKRPDYEEVSDDFDNIVQSKPKKTWVVQDEMDEIAGGNVKYYFPG